MTTGGAAGDHPVVLFDGVCNLCTGWVQFLVPRDEDATLRFAPLQSDVGEALLAECGYERTDRESIVLVEDGDCYRKSTAVLRMAAHLDGAWPLARHLGVVPRFLRDAVYDLVARYRYAVFGRKAQCMVPSEDVRHRFLAMADTEQGETPADATAPGARRTSTD
jgi:predicted DCC family thiol-disulfide oxidoreductase YuxK